MAIEITDEYIREHAPVLWNRHVRERILVYCRKTTASGEWSSERRWLQHRSISTKDLLTHFVKVKDAAQFLGIGVPAVRTAISKGRLQKPLFDYSRYRYSPETYDMWIRKAAVKAYAANRRRRR